MSCQELPSSELFPARAFEKEKIGLLHFFRKRFATNFWFINPIIPRVLDYHFFFFRILDNSFEKQITKKCNAIKFAIMNSFIYPWVEHTEYSDCKPQLNQSDISVNKGVGSWHKFAALFRSYTLKVRY